MRQRVHGLVAVGCVEKRKMAAIEGAAVLSVAILRQRSVRVEVWYRE